MPSVRELIRFLPRLAIPIFASLFVRYLFPKHDVKARPPSRFHPILADIGFTPRSHPVTYRSFEEASDLRSYQRILNNTAVTRGADTTAIILNWSRFPNVLLITSLLCGPWLDGVISEVLIWNNSPAKFSYEYFKDTGCTPDRLRIHNSPKNMLFQARYLACAQVNTPYCFIQDDDYLIRPEIIEALHTRIAEDSSAPAIHLLPPHEHLSTILREIHVPRSSSSYFSDIHTSSAWLGHGTILERSQAELFLALMYRLHVTEEEIAMADNYFTILGNRVPEVWFDQDFELGGGKPFTEGEEGHERNVKHIMKATRYLDSILRCEDESCSAKSKRVPYTSLSDHQPSPPWTRAACGGSACVMETNIRLLPRTIIHESTNVTNILDLEARNQELLGEDGRAQYLGYPPSHAVDTQGETCFRSPEDAKNGDVIALDMLSDVGKIKNLTAVELAWLVDSGTEQILKASTFQTSNDNMNWHTIAVRPICYDSTVRDPETLAGSGSRYLRECSVQVLVASDSLYQRVSGRYFRAQLQEDRDERWGVCEVWLRGV
ncbi:hypothetical protein OBBRIDRAFT_778345 [Obba rivulosa]|uniref:Uncharacterized protein n=1 Tax=Obba rivulosa TaxID=1052685 RepID=A0A8E2AWU7_9APHY|nr:hypothetical protein OBBRIDRAFT_778345 [Obba rivulosa]